MEDWKEKVKAAHDMVHALCQPRGSKGSREWIMSIPARPDHDPDLVIASGLRAAENEIKRLHAEIQQFRDAYAHDREIMADNVAYIDSYEKRIEVMEATLDAIREVVPEGDNTKWSSWQMITKIHAILYPKEPING